MGKESGHMPALSLQQPKEPRNIFIFFNLFLTEQMSVICGKKKISVEPFGEVINIFHLFEIFYRFIKMTQIIMSCFIPFFRRVNLGLSGINILWVLDSKA